MLSIIFQIIMGIQEGFHELENYIVKLMYCSFLNDSQKMKKIQQVICFLPSSLSDVDLSSIQVLFH